MQEINRKQIVFNTTTEFHQQLKLMALLKNIPMSEWIHNALYKAIELQKQRKDKE